MTAGLSTDCSEWQAVEDGSMEYSNSDYECNKNPPLVVIVMLQDRTIVGTRKLTLSPNMHFKQTDS